MRNKHIIMIVFILSLIIRLYFLFTTHLPNTDEIYYTDIAKNIASGKGYVSNYLETIGLSEEIPYPAHLTFPLLPPILSFIFKLFGYSLFKARILSLLLGLSIPFIIYNISKHLINSKVATYTYIFSSFSLPLLFYSVFAQTEALYTFFILIGLSLLLIGIKKERKFILLSIFLLGVSIWIRWQSILFIPLIILYAILFLYNRKIINPKYLCIILLLSLFFISLFMFWFTSINNLADSKDVFLAFSTVPINDIEAQQIDGAISSESLPKISLIEHIKRKLIDIGLDLSKNLYLAMTPLVYFFCLVGFVLLKKRFIKLSPLYLFILPTLLVPSPLYDTRDSIRYLVPILPLFFIFSSYSIWLLKSYIKDNKKYLRTLIMITILLTFIVFQYSQINNYKISGYSCSNKKIGVWLNTLVNENNTVCSPKPMIAYYAKSKWLKLPYADTNQSFDILHKYNISYVILSKQKPLHPDLQLFFDENITEYSNYILIKETESPKYKIYKKIN